MFFDAQTNGIRDLKDAREASARFFAIRQQSQIVRPEVGARYPRTGQNSSAMAPRDCGGRVDACGNPSVCEGSVLGFNTIAGEAPDFPVAGGAPGINEGSVIVSSGNAGTYKAVKFFFEARDSAAGFAVVPALLTSATISGCEQLVGTGGEFGITSAVFALTCEPLPINWDAWQDSGQQRLTLRFGNFLAAQVEIEVFGVFWGDRVSCP